MKDGNTPFTNPYAPADKTDGIIRGAWGYPPEFFVQKGQEAKAIADSLNFSLWTRLNFLAADMKSFGQKGPWDIQRLGTGEVDQKYVDYATVAIGLYGGAAGMPRDYALSISNVYARFNSNFGKDAVMSRVFGSLPQRNVFNTDLGYELEALMRSRR